MTYTREQIERIAELLENEVAFTTERVEAGRMLRHLLAALGDKSRILEAAMSLNKDLWDAVNKLQQDISDHEAVHADKRRLAFEINRALGGTAAAPSLCDVISLAREVKAELDLWKNNLG